MKLKYKWICPICNNVLKTRSDLAKHQQELIHYKHVPNKKSICSICNKEFNSYRELLRHCKAEKHYKNNLKDYYEWKCPFCTEIFKSRHKLQNHKKIEHPNCRVPTTINICYCQYCNKKFNYLSSKNRHEKYCNLNPNHIKFIGHPNTAETKQKLSIIQKERIKLGLNHGWMSCHSSKKSYPEEFFTQVIENEFDDKNYEYNLLFYQYRLDFAWPHKKLCIEIDGSQHERDLKQKESDIRKDKKLIENGWKVLRIKWIDLYNNPKYYIEQAKEFINSNKG